MYSIKHHKLKSSVEIILQEMETVDDLRSFADRKTNDVKISIQKPIDYAPRLLLSLSRSLPLRFPIQVRIMTDKDTRQYHLKKLFDLSIKSTGVCKPHG